MNIPILSSYLEKILLHDSIRVSTSVSFIHASVQGRRKVFTAGGQGQRKVVTTGGADIYCVQQEAGGAIVMVIY